MYWLPFTKFEEIWAVISIFFLNCPNSVLFWEFTYMLFNTALYWNWWDSSAGKNAAATLTTWIDLLQATSTHCPLMSKQVLAHSCVCMCVHTYTHSPLFFTQNIEILNTTWYYPHDIMTDYFSPLVFFLRLDSFSSFLWTLPNLVFVASISWMTVLIISIHYKHLCFSSMHSSKVPVLYIYWLGSLGSTNISSLHSFLIIKSCLILCSAAIVDITVIFHHILNHLKLCSNKHSTTCLSPYPWRPNFTLYEALSLV